MLDEARIVSIAREAADYAFGPDTLSRVLLDRMLGPDTADLIEITLVLKDAVDTRRAPKALSRIRRHLEREGEDRFPIVHFIDERHVGELEEQDDDQS